MEVINTMTVSTKKHFRFRQNVFGHQILQIGHPSKDWDTNTGRDVGLKYVAWRDASRYEAEEYLNRNKR